MKTVGIIAEYNPFHNGHAYQIEQAKKVTGADFCVVVMSGNFVQRGTVSVMDKYIRTKAALSSGADLVLELPVRFATASAEIFALGGVALLHQLNCIDFICFGSETGDIEPLKAAAALLYEEPPLYRQYLKQYIKEGNSFPAARKMAMSSFLSSEPVSAQWESPLTAETVLDSLNTPNNLLGIEYCKALLRLKSTMIPVAVKRMDAGYHAKDLPDPKQEGHINMTSATSLRKVLDHSFRDDFSLYVPETAYHLYKSLFQVCFPIQPDDLSSLLLYKLRLEQSAGYTAYADVSDELSNKIRQNTVSETFSEFSASLKSKDLTLTRCQRALLHIVLGITKDNLNQSLQTPVDTYARLLGFKKTSSVLLRSIADNASIPLVTKVADAASVLSGISKQMLTEDLFAADLYRSLVCQKFGFRLLDEYRTGPVILPDA